MSAAAHRAALVAGMVVLLLSACVSTTTGPPPPEADNEDAAFYNYQLGARYYRNGKYDLARDRLKLSLELDPDCAIAWSTLALTYEQLGNLRLAEESYQQALKVGPRNYEVQNTYAVFLCRHSRFDEAQRWFERAIRTPENDDSYITLVNAGVCMMQKPDYETAEAYFREALAQRAGYPEALFQLTLLKHQTGDDLNARGFLERFLSSNDPTAAILYLGAQIEDKLDDTRARDDYAEQLLEDYPNSPEARSLKDAKWRK